MPFIINSKKTTVIAYTSLIITINIGIISNYLQCYMTYPNTYGFTILTKVILQKEDITNWLSTLNLEK